MGPGRNPAGDELGLGRPSGRTARRGDRCPVSEAHGSALRSITLPFAIFTAIWGSTWIVIRSQLGTVPPQWSVTYRFIVAAAAMAAVAKWKGDDLNIGRKGLLAAAFLGFTQFC